MKRVKLLFIRNTELVTTALSNNAKIYAQQRREMQFMESPQKQIL